MIDAWLACGRKLNSSSFFQRLVGAILIDRLQTARRHTNANELAQLGHPDAVLVQIRVKLSRHHLGDVATHSTLLLRQTAAMNDAAATDTRTGDGANF